MLYKEKPFFSLDSHLNMLHKSCVQAQTSSINPLTDTFLAILEKSSASLFAKFLEAHMGSSPKFCGGPSETPWMKEMLY